ncbi:cation:proton antiporter [Actinoplanes regularis]|uniref:Potassium/proton antiporter membrane subunit, CPA2 family n=1 Tax=Actinoplanes regularis TaxID=52697 RepID=A0A239K3K7_9ACTN|nr:cation:proton antiporter [Actinoplanes regularis]GIE92411.1 potassium transporter [Actinoplanes regularis]SNT12976.1 potassium/proton antiporter membrane subunit, CPA2 family [Actinoplanes regularis]
MHASLALLLELGIVLVVLSVLGSVARWLAIPAIPLYLLAGLALGDGGFVSVPEANGFVRTGASIGVVLLLLTLGLEFTTEEFAGSARRHVPSAAVDLVSNAVPGLVAGLLLGLDLVGVLALAGATWVSSSGIVSRLLSDLRRLGNRETPSVLAVLVIEDFAMAVYLPLLAVLGSGGTWWQALIGITLAVTVVAAAFAGSHRWGGHVNRWLAHPDPEQLMLRVLGSTLVVAALAEMVHVSAAIGALLIGLTLTGENAVRAGAVLAPLRDLFAAAFFLSIGLMVRPADLVDALPVAAGLALAGVVTKILTGWYAARRDGTGRRARLRAGTALIARGEFSIVVVTVAGSSEPVLASTVVAYTLLLAVAGPLLARYLPVLAGRYRPGRTARADSTLAVRPGW